MQVDAEVKQQSEPMLTHEKHEGNRNLITFFWSFLIHMNVLIWARIYSSCNQAQGGQGTLKWLCYTLEIPRRETWASLHIVFSAGRNASDACSRCWEGWWCIHKHLYFLIFSLFMRLVQHKKMERYVQWHLCTAKLRRTLLWVFVEQNLFSHAHSYRSSAHCYLWAWSWIKAWQIRWNRWLSTCQWMETWWCNRIRRMDRFFLLVANQSHEFP